MHADLPRWGGTKLEGAIGFLVNFVSVRCSSRIGTTRGGWCRRTNGWQTASKISVGSSLAAPTQSFSLRCWRSRSTVCCCFFMLCAASAVRIRVLLLFRVGGKGIGTQSAAGSDFLRRPSTERPVADFNERYYSL